MTRPTEPRKAAGDAESLLPGLSSWLNNAARHLGRLGYTVELTEAELEQRIASRFPWTGEKWGLSLTLTEPRLSILADGLLRLRLALEVSGGATGSEGSLLISGHLRYQTDAGSFFIADVCIEHLELGNRRRPLWPLRKVLEPAMTWYFQHHPVVELQTERRGQALMRAVLDGIETRHGHLRLHLKLMRGGAGKS